MILLDALYINRGGGKILLDELVKHLESNKVNVFYLFDKRIEGNYQFVPQNRRLFICAGIINRTSFYLRESRRFTLVICFGGIPPVLNFSKQLWCYFQNVVLAKIDQDAKFKEQTIFYFKLFYFKIFKIQVHKWLVQTPNVAKLLMDSYGVHRSKIVVTPFFKEYEPFKRKACSRKAFLYVSDAYPHKNHIRLFEAFKKLSSEKEILLYVTIDSEKGDSLNLAEWFKDDGTNIINLGFDTSVDISKIYKLADCIVFPSIAESLGLGLIEAAQFGIPVIASDMEYVHSIITPSGLFNPLSVESIYNAMRDFLNADCPTTPSLLVGNSINAMIAEIRNWDTSETP